MNETSLEKDYERMLKETDPRKSVANFMNEVSVCILPQESSDPTIGSVAAMEIAVECMLTREILLFTGEKGTAKTRILKTMANCIAMDEAGTGPVTIVCL